MFNIEIKSLRYFITLSATVLYLILIYYEVSLTTLLVLNIIFTLTSRFILRNSLSILIIPVSSYLSSITVVYVIATLMTYIYPVLPYKLVMILLNITRPEYLVLIPSISLIISIVLIRNLPRRTSRYYVRFKPKHIPYAVASLALVCVLSLKHMSLELLAVYLTGIILGCILVLARAILLSEATILQLTLSWLTIPYLILRYSE